MKTEEVEPLVTFGQIGDAGLVWVQLKSQIGQHRRRPAAALFGPSSGGTDDDEVIGVSDQHP